jgi:RNA polymerase sigma factor (sigma-70 family)
MTDVVAFAARAQRYVQRKGWQTQHAEDIVSTMVLDVLEHPDRPAALPYVYLRALDTLHPRVNTDGRRGRPARRTVSLHAPLRADDDRTVEDILPAAPAADREPWAPAVLARLLRRLPPGEARLLRGYYLEGQREHQLAHILGITESRVSQLLTQAQQRLTYTLHLERKRHAPRRARVSGV